MQRIDHQDQIRSECVNFRTPIRASRLADMIIWCRDNLGVDLPRHPLLGGSALDITGTWAMEYFRSGRYLPGGPQYSFWIPDAMHREWFRLVWCSSDD